MRTFPIDADRTDLRSTGVVSPNIEWVDGPNGNRIPDPNGRQALDSGPNSGNTNLPLWTVECVAPADANDERDRAEVIAVTIASQNRPDVGGFGVRLLFAHLSMASQYVRKDGKISAPRWTASAVRVDGHHQGKPQPQAA